jgi:cellobiose-specific phosphotransferase system component IIA
MTIQQHIEQARAKMTTAMEYAYAGQMAAADKLIQECRTHMLCAERLCDDVAREAKQTIEKVRI